MVLGNFQTHLENSRARLTVLAVSAGGVVWIFFLSCHVSFLSGRYSWLVVLGLTAL